jgi:hypothetical protein
MDETMQPGVVPARAGLGWLATGWRLFAFAPFAWLGLMFAYWFIITLVSLVPLAGVVAAGVLVPVFSVGFMAAARSAAAKQPPRVTHLFEGFRANPRAGIRLGIVYLLLIGCVMGGSALVDGGTLARWMLGGTRPEESRLASGEFTGALLAAALLYMPVMMFYWFAPVLAAWRGASAAKAMFFSFFACLHNWAAFLVYGIAVGVLAFLVPLTLVSLTMLFAQGRPAATAFILPLLLVMMPVLFASFYASYRDIFGDPAVDPEVDRAPV